MTKTISLLLLSFCLMISWTIYVTANDKPRPYEEIYPEIGYKTVEEASDDFEQHFKQHLMLPLRVPPISFTHHFGRFNDLDGDMNDSFEVKFINDKLSENHYIITVRPTKYKISIPEKYVIKAFELKNGNAATYMKVAGFNVLVFECGDWQYMLNIDERVSITVPLEVLVDIAESIDY
ncbi:hypothetical protein [Solibacillus sp. FSL H8-0538]|uniref:hypothetical protein n=1 Tax=Solibacillus sp. FSL H8-0538 TaxID=2921400 RepID=UPI0030FBA92A